MTKVGTPDVEEGKVYYYDSVSLYPPGTRIKKNVEEKPPIKVKVGRPRIHPIQESSGEIKPRGAPAKYKDAAERRAGKQALDRKYYHATSEIKIAKVRAYQALNIEALKVTRKQYYLKKKLEKEQVVE